MEVPSEEFAQTSNKHRQIEVLNDEFGGWRRGEVLKFSVDGAILIRYDDEKQNPQWLTLAKLRYRWYTSTAVERRPTSGESRKRIRTKTIPVKIRGSGRGAPKLSC